MNFNKLLILLTVFTLFLAACGVGNETPNKATNANVVAPANTNANAPNANNPIATTTATPPPTTNSADTIKPVVTAYYEALKTKNDAALRKVYSKETLAFFEKEMKDEGKKSIFEYITQIEEVPAQPFEVRNEQINGNVAIAEMRSPQYPNGIKIKFVKEDGEWKMTNESPEFPKK